MHFSDLFESKKGSFKQTHTCGLREVVSLHGLCVEVDRYVAGDSTILTGLVADPTAGESEMTIGLV